MYIRVNDINLYYEVSGAGSPIVLLHGNGESHKVFDKFVPVLARDYTVYAVDSRCHGKSDRTKGISYDLMASDIMQFISALGLEKPILYGFSDGGIIGLLIAMREPSMLSKLIVCGANLFPSGMKKGTLRKIKVCHAFTRSKLLRLMLEQPQIDASELKNITIPVLVLAGERDIITEEHTRLIASSIPNSRLLIVPKANHGSYIVHSDRLYRLTEDFISSE